MARINARHTLVRAKTKGADPLVDAVLDGDELSVKNYEAAKDINTKPLKKMYVEASLLASCDFMAISSVLEIPAHVLRAYHDFFYSVEELDRLSKMVLIEESGTDDERLMKIWAFSQGLEFIAWRLGKAVNINPISGLKELFTLCVYKSKEALFAGSDSESGKEATKWTKLSMDLARLLKVWVMDNDAARKDIELALKTIDPTFEGFDSLDDTPNEEEELPGG